MKTILFFLFFLVSVALVKAQELPNSGFDKVQFSEADKTVRAEFKPISNKVHVKSSLVYYWYSAGAIHSTQGGYSGKLLNGSYNEFYPDKNLKQQGIFKSGLKDGIWKNWKADGVLLSQTTWKNGTLLPDSTVSFWKKIRKVLKRRRKQSDTLSAPKKK